MSVEGIDSGRLLIIPFLVLVFSIIAGMIEWLKPKCKSLFERIAKALEKK